MAVDYEKLGAFYLGREFDPATSALKDELVLYDSKDLTTHAVCVGMTGSGKTGLCLSMLEEAAIDGIPAICIDPKGDLGNLLLAFPELRPADFQPWVDPAEAEHRLQHLEHRAQCGDRLRRQGVGGDGVFVHGTFRRRRAPGRGARGRTHPTSRVRTGPFGLTSSSRATHGLFCA